MLTLLLFRHAKSSWQVRNQPDAERPLNARGRRAAPLMGRYMAANGLAPDHVLCSSAVRTRETAALALAEMPGAPEPVFLDALYLAAPARMLAEIHKAAATVKSLMLIGHNPGMHEFVIDLAGSGNGEARRRTREKFPTAALAVLAFDVARWTDVQPGVGRLDLFVTPRLVEDDGEPDDD